MPPLTAWEWVEAYGALSADPARVHGDWDGARDEVRERLEVLCPAAGLDSWLENTRAMAKRPAERVICSGSGWGALENLRRARDGEPLMCPQLDFGQVGAEQADWVRLLECGTLAPEGQGSLPACIVDVSARVDGARAGICRLSREAAASGGNRVGGWALA